MKKNKVQKTSLYSKNQSFKDAINLDRIFLKLFTKNRKKFLIRVSIFFTKLGNGQLWLLFSCIVFLYYVPIGWVFQAAIMIQLYIQILLKKLFKRMRPFHKFLDVEVLYDPPDPYSFPSGHTCAAFTMVFVSQLVLPVMLPYFLTIALIIAFSRIYLIAHYPSDVFAGVIIAYFSARLSYFLNQWVTGIVL